MAPKIIRMQPSAIRRLKFISISFCVTIGIETKDRKPPIMRMSPRIKIPNSLRFIITKLNHILHINVFGYNSICWFYKRKKTKMKRKLAKINLTKLRFRMIDYLY